MYWGRGREDTAFKRAAVIQLTDYSTEVTETWRQCNDTFKCWKRAVRILQMSNTPKIKGNESIYTI